jgi:hypothetical protein
MKKKVISDKKIKAKSPFKKGNRKEKEIKKNYSEDEEVTDSPVPFSFLCFLSRILSNTWWVSSITPKNAQTLLLQQSQKPYPHSKNNLIPIQQPLHNTIQKSP